MKKKLLTLTMLVIGFASQAQIAGAITGSIKEGGNQKTIESASINLLKASDSSLVKTSIADELGNFSFENVKLGQYLVSASAISHKKVYSQQLTIDSLNRMLIIPMMQLTPIEKSCRKWWWFLKNNSSNEKLIKPSSIRMRLSQTQAVRQWKFLKKLPALA